MQLKRFFKIWKKSIILSIQNAMAYKSAFFILLLSLFIGDIIIPIVSIIIYKVSAGIPGWTVHEFVLFQGTLIIVMGIWRTLFSELLGDTISAVEEGTFDKIKLKPFPSLAFLTANSFNPDGIAEIIAGIAIVSFALIKLHLFNMLLIAYFSVIILAVLFEYSLTIIAASFSFLFIKSWRLFELISVSERFSRYPINIYSPALKFILTFILPAAIASYYPATILTGKQPVITILIISLPVIAFFAFSLWLWSVSMKKYSSAGG